MAGVRAVAGHRGLVFVAAAVVALVVTVAAALRYPSASVVVAYFDGSHEVTLVYASCRGRGAVSLGDNIYAYVHAKLGLLREANLSMFVDVLSSGLRVCGCGVVRGPLPPGARGAAVAYAPSPAYGRGFYFWIVRLDSGALVAVAVLDKLVFDAASVLYVVMASFLLLMALDSGAGSGEEVRGVDLFIAVSSIVVTGFALIPVLLYLFFSVSGVLSAYVYARTGFILAVVLIVILLIRVFMEDKSLFIILTIIIFPSIIATMTSIGDSVKLLQALSMLGVGQGLVGLIGPLVFSLLVSEALEARDIRGYPELRRLLLVTSFILIIIGLAGLAVYEPGAFTSPSLSLASWPLVVVLVVLAGLLVVLRSGEEEVGLPGVVRRG